MKKTLIALSLSVFTIGSLASPAMADNHMHHKQKAASKKGKEFFKNLAHASFMPNIMKHLKKNKTSLGISDKQMSELQTYHKKHSPEVKNMVNDLIWTEKEAHKLALNNFPPQQVIEVGELSLKIRHDIMMQKVRCRSFLKSVLSPKQYKRALTTYAE